MYQIVGAQVASQCQNPFSIMKERAFRPVLLLFLFYWWQFIRRRFQDRRQETVFAEGEEPRPLGEGAGDCLGWLVAGWVVRHGPVGTPDRLTTNGGHGLVVARRSGGPQTPPPFGRLYERLEADNK